MCLQQPQESKVPIVDSRVSIVESSYSGLGKNGNNPKSPKYLY